MRDLIGPDLVYDPLSFELGRRNIRNAGRDVPASVGWVMTLRSDHGLGEDVDEVKGYRAGTGD